MLTTTDTYGLCARRMRMGQILYTDNAMHMRTLHDFNAAGGVVLNTRDYVSYIGRTLPPVPKGTAINVHTSQDGMNPQSELRPLRVFLDYLALSLGKQLLDWRLHFEPAESIPSMMHFDAHPGTYTTCTNIRGMGTCYPLYLDDDAARIVGAMAPDHDVPLPEMRAIARRQQARLRSSSVQWQSLERGQTLAFRAANLPRPLLHHAPDNRADSVTLVAAYH